jgi:hypothetical protein
METIINRKSDFIELLSDFTFNINYYKDKNPEGKLSWYEERGEWKFNPRKDYWNFDISINGYKIDNVLENWKKNKYGEYLEEKLNLFIESNNSSYLSTLVKSDCFDQLNTLLGKLNLVKSQFYTEKIQDEYSPFFYNALRHPKININYSDLNKVYDEDNDRFVTELIYFFLNRKNEVIESAISFLENKIKWLEMIKDQSIDSINVNLKSSDLVWTRSDTDLLELVTALYEIRAINHSQHPLTRKEAIEFFSKFFDRDIKDAESKLSRATERKKDVSPFLKSLKESFDNYAIKKEQK